MPRPLRPILIAAAAVILLSAPASAAREKPQPSADRVEALAGQLAGMLAGRNVTLPDGTLAPVMAPEGQEEAGTAILTRSRLANAFATVSEARAWPATWLVIQDRARPYDLILSIELEEESGNLREPQAVFTTPRRDYSSAKSVEVALHESRGERPGRRLKNVVTVEYATRTVTSYVYEAPPAGPGTKGLAALLAPGSLIRESRSADLGDGVHRTVGIVLQEARFVPSDCASCEGRLFGHADSGRVLVVLAREETLEHQLDLTPLLGGRDGTPLVPRFPCVEDDEDPATAQQPIQERFRDREMVRLIDLQDIDGDGRALEFSIPARFVRCGESTSLIVSIDPASRTLRTREAREGVGESGPPE